jgi:hypothetical protein
MEDLSPRVAQQMRRAQVLRERAERTRRSAEVTVQTSRWIRQHTDELVERGRAIRSAQRRRGTPS